MFDTVSKYVLPGGCIHTHTAERPAVCRRIIGDRGDLRCPKDLQWILRRRFTFISDRMLLFSEMSYTFRSPLEEGDSFRPPSLKRDRKIRNKMVWYQNFTEAWYVPSYGIKSIPWLEISELGKNIFAGAYVNLSS